MKRSAAAACLLALGVGITAAGASDIKITKLPQPAFPRTLATKPAPAGAPRLVIVSSRRNAITDIAAWFRRNRLTLREYALPDRYDNGLDLPPYPRSFSPSFDRMPVVRAIRQKTLALLVYGGGVLAVSDPAQFRAPKVRYALDLTTFAMPPSRPQGDGQEIKWAAQASGVLYVANAHWTYASTSGGRTGYVTAIDPRRGKVLWRNGPLLANASTFELAGNYLISGYGFTAEPDFLFLLDRRDGKVIQRLAVPSAPDYIIRKGRNVFVRTYDHDLVLRLKG